MGRILIVEDDSTTRSVLRSSLRLVGHEVVEAVDGEAAIALLAQQTFDAVLLDVMMPKKSGYEVLEWLQGDPAGDRTPVVMITAVDDPQGLLREAKGGAIDHVAKPFSYDDVKRAVDDAMALTPEQLREQRDKLLGAAISFEATLDQPAEPEGEHETSKKRRRFLGRRKG